MSDNIVNLGADERLKAENEAYIKSLFGPIRIGFDVIVDGRRIPNMHMHEEGDEILFILDGRLGFAFPRELAGQAASFAANAMAIGAGYASLNCETRGRPFAPKVGMIGDNK